MKDEEMEEFLKFEDRNLLKDIMERLTKALEKIGKGQIEIERFEFKGATFYFNVGCHVDVIDE